MLNRPSSKRALLNAYEWSVAVILGATALAKAISATGDAPILNTTEPMLGIPYWLFFCLGAVLETVVLGLLLFARRWRLRHAAVLWLSGLFILYRLGLYFGYQQASCPCLGTVTESLRISPEQAAALLLASIAYMVVGSTLALVVGNGWGKTNGFSELQLT